jgi:hypothetical protein
MESSEQEAFPPRQRSPAELDAGLPVRLGFGALTGWRGELLIVLGFFLATCALTWPLVVTLDLASGVRGDYYNNLWNAWWVKHSFLNGHSPYWTDYFYYPEGISLRRHTLSPLNSVTLALLGSAFGPHQGFNLLILGHFALSAWCFSLLARALSGSTLGGILGGLVYSFCPFHYFYLCQINVFSFEFLPLALLFFLKHAREGGRANFLGVVGSVLGMALTLEYNVVYCYLTLGVLFLCARGWRGPVPLATVTKRWLLSGGVAALFVVAACFPLLVATLTEGNLEAQTSANVIEKKRFNDLLGFFWIGGDEECTVSWPTMLGYSTLLMIVLGWRRVRALWPWLVVGGVFFVLSLGDELSIGRQKMGIPLPYAILKELPVLSMLRKSDRCYMLIQLVAGVLVAAGWSAIATRLRTARVQGGTWCACAATLMLELTGAPFGRFTIPTSSGFELLKNDPNVTAVMDMPAMIVHVMNGRFDYYQTLHEKKITLGYTTSIALQPEHDQRLMQLVNLYLEYLHERNRALPRVASQLGVQRLIHYKTYGDNRPRDANIDGYVLWRPFFFWRRPLVFVRQVGEYIETPYPKATWDFIRLLFTRALGPPLYEDDMLAIFEVQDE